MPQIAPPHAPRRQLLRTAGALALVAGLAACALPGLGPEHVDISQAELQSLMEKNMPVQRRLLEAFDITLSQPELTLVPEKSRMSMALSVGVAERLFKRAFKGRIVLDHGLRYEPADHTVRLTDVKLQQLRVDGVPANMDRQINALGGLIVEQALQDAVVHTLREADLLRAAGLGRAPGAISVTSTGIRITLNPTTAP